MKLLKNYFVFLIVIVIFVTTVFFPLSQETSFLSTILGLSTFLFGIFLAFSISDRHSRINKIKDNDTIERADLTALYNFSKIYGNKFQTKIKKSIDEYLIVSLDYMIWDYDKTEKYYLKIVDIVNSLKPKTAIGISLHDDIVSLLISIGRARKSTIEVIGDRLSRFEWLVFLFLSFIIISSLVLMNTGSVIFIVMTLGLSVSVILVLYLLYKLDNLSWKEESIVFEPFQKTFESIGLMRYYPDALILQNRVKNHVYHDYRLATYPKPYPDMTGKKISVIKRSSK